MDPVQTFEYKGMKVEIFQDSEPISPREDDNLVTLACWHTRYNLGDEQIQHMTKEELCESVEDILVLTPLYLFDHSGITISTEPFSCRWDSGQVGWAYITKESAEEMGCVGPEWTPERLLENLKGEVKVYDQYLTNDVYGYVITKDDEEMDSVWGYFGQDSACQAARDYIDSKVKG